MTLTNLQATVTKTAAFSGAQVDVSGITGSWTIKWEVTSLTQGASARIGLADNPDGTTAVVAGPAFDFVGAIGPSYDNARSIKKQDFPDLALGIANGKVAVNLLYLSAGSVQYRVWVES